jgi:hypothetical protein
MEGRNKIQQTFVDREIEQKMIRAGLNPDNLIRQTLDNDASIVGPPGEASLRVHDGCGGWLSIEDRIEQLRGDPHFRPCFPDVPKVGRDDEEGIKQNFDKIASGEVVVIK